MKTSTNGVELIKKFEGFVDRWYKDPVGVWTCCYGHTEAAGAPYRKDNPNRKFTKAEGTEILKRDLVQYEKAVAKSISVPLTQNQFDALVSFTYNLGEGNLASSTLRKKLNAKDYKGAAAEFRKWNRADGKVLPGLVRRRSEEAALFLKASQSPASDPSPSQTTTTPAVDTASQPSWLRLVLRLFGIS